jgi:hypothetical protein
VTAPRFDPWRAVDEHPELRVSFDPVAGLMGGGFHIGRAGRSFIVLDPNLDEPRRQVVLTHELIHHERGGGTEQDGAPPLLAALVEREEQWVDAEVARRLVPTDELLALIDELTADDGGLGPPEVAAHFAVTPAVAERALRQLARPDPVAIAPRPAMT